MGMKTYALCRTRMAGNTVMPRQPYYGPPQPIRQEYSGQCLAGDFRFFMPMVGLICI